MIFGRTKLELKVGVFVFIGLAILVMFVLSIGKFKTWSSGYQVKFVFNFINGVKLGAPVRFAGMDVGEVEKIRAVFDEQEAETKVFLDCWIENGTKIPVDSTIWVNTLGLLGEKYIEIIPGEDYANVLAKNQLLRGVDPIPMHEVTKIAKNIADTLEESLEKIKNKEGTVGKLLYDEAVYNEILSLVTDIRKNPWKLLRKTKEKK